MLEQRSLRNRDTSWGERHYENLLPLPCLHQSLHMVINFHREYCPAIILCISRDVRMINAEMCNQTSQLTGGIVFNYDYFLGAGDCILQHIDWERKNCMNMRVRNLKSILRKHVHSFFNTANI